MFKFIIYLLYIFPILLYSQGGKNLYILKSNGDVIDQNKNRRPHYEGKFDKIKLDSYESATVTRDTLRYVHQGNFNTNFGFYSQDVALQYFQAPADLIIRGVGFSCADDAGVQDGTDISIRIIRLNWTWEELSSISQETYMGYYPAEGDSFNNTDYFGENASGEWIDSTNGLFSLPPWTDNIDPTLNSFEYDIWSDEGKGVKIIPQKQESAGNYQWIMTDSLGFEPVIRHGEIFAVVIKNNGNLLDSSRIGFWASADVGIPGWKYYENGRNDSNSPGWWTRNYTWDFAVAVDLGGGPWYFFTNSTDLGTTISTDSRIVETSIIGREIFYPENRLKVVNLRYSINNGDFLKTAMDSVDLNTYRGEIPGQEGGTFVRYYFEAIDSINNQWESVEYSYNIFKPQNKELLVLFNGGDEGRAELLTPFYLQDTFTNFHDLWAGYGPVDEELLSNYAVVLEIHSEYGPEDDNRDAIRSFVNSGRRLIVVGQEALGYLTGYRDSTFEPGDYEYDILGVEQSFNDVNFDTSNNIGNEIRSLVRAVDNTNFGDSLATWVVENKIDSLFHDPPGILGSDNWIDQFIPREDINSEVFITGFSFNGIERPIAHNYIHSNGSEITFFAFDPLTLSTDSIWIGNSTKNPLFQALSNIVIPSVEEIESEIPSEFMLYQNYPNPFNPTTTIKYGLPNPSTDGVKGEGLTPTPAGAIVKNVKLIVYDILGREVATLVDQKQKPGNYEVEFKAANLTSGIYFYRLTSANFISTKKMLLIK